MNPLTNPPTLPVSTWALAVAGKQANGNAASQAGSVRIERFVRILIALKIDHSPGLPSELSAYPEEELHARVEAIQNRTHDLMGRAGHAVDDMLTAITAAKAAVPPVQLKPLPDLQRKAQWRLDFVNAENSMGFHAPQ